MSRARLALLIVVAAAIAATVVVVRSSHPPRTAGRLTPAETARVAGFAREQARTLGDPGLRRATVILGPQTVQATGGSRLSKAEALIIIRGRFRCDHCHDSTTSGFGPRWHATALEYTVYWPTLAVLGYGSGDGPHSLNLPPAKSIKRLVTVTF